MMLNAYIKLIMLQLPKMTCYTTFCSKQLEAASLLQKLTETSGPFRDIVRKCQNNVATRGMPLSSFLIKPMQRITKYPLLISKILENTPDNHPGKSIFFSYNYYYYLVNNHKEKVPVQNKRN